MQYSIVSWVLLEICNEIINQIFDRKTYNIICQSVVLIYATHGAGTSWCPGRYVSVSAVAANARGCLLACMQTTTT